MEKKNNKDMYDVEQNKNNVLYVSYDGLSDPLGQSQVIPYLLGLSKLGWKITVLSLEKSQALARQQSSIQQQLDNHGISWIFSIFQTSPPVISSIINIIDLQNKAKQEYSRKPFFIVHCRSYMAALIGLSIKKQFGAKFIFDMRGFWADEKKEDGSWNVTNPVYGAIYKYFKKMENQFITGADEIISLTQKGKQVILEQYSVIANQLQISVIPCCADIDFFNRDKADSYKRNQYKEQLKIEDDDFILCYLGGLGASYILDEMLDFFKVLKKNRNNAKFLFLTQASEESIRFKCTEKNIPADQVISYSAKREEVPTLLTLCHVSVFFIKPIFSKQASCPTKLAELLSMGIPYITNSKIGDVDPFTKDNNCGFVIESFTEREYQRAVANIDKLTQISQEFLRGKAIEHYSLNSGVQKYHQVYSRLTNQ